MKKMTRNEFLKMAGTSAALVVFNSQETASASKKAEKGFPPVIASISTRAVSSICTGTATPPTNMDVTFTEEESKDMTYGDKAAKVKVVDYAFVNPILNNWIDQWNRTINN